MTNKNIIENCQEFWPDEIIFHLNLDFPEFFRGFSFQKATFWGPRLCEAIGSFQTYIDR